MHNIFEYMLHFKNTPNLGNINRHKYQQNIQIYIFNAQRYLTHYEVVLYNK